MGEEQEEEEMTRWAWVWFRLLRLTCPCPLAWVPQVSILLFHGLSSSLGGASLGPHEETEFQESFLLCLSAWPSASPFLLLLNASPPFSPTVPSKPLLPTHCMPGPVPGPRVQNPLA